MNILTPDEEVDYLNMIEGLLDQIRLCDRVHSKWNECRKHQCIKDIETMQKKMYARMKRLEIKISKAS
jgi:hypothetical protein